MTDEEGLGYTGTAFPDTHPEVVAPQVDCVGAELPPRTQTHTSAELWAAQLEAKRAEAKDLNVVTPTPRGFSGPGAAAL